VDYLSSFGIGFDGSTESQPSPEGATLGLLWVDVEDEDPPLYYSADPAANTDFLSALVAAMAARGISPGVYTTKTYWAAITDDAAGFSGFPLWYPRYDGEESMDFFQPFAGWTVCAIKQTGGDVGYCGVSQVDSDYLLD
jgi:hypothetical protein